MNTASRHMLERLLARGAFSGPEKERILDAVLAQSTTRKKALLPWGQKLAGALALTLLLVLGGVWVSIPRQQSLPGKLRAKGAATQHPEVIVGCQGGCRQGSQLLFRIAGLSRAAYFAAYALRPDGERIWYFPPRGKTTKVPASAVAHTLPNGVLLGPEHPPGTYQIHVFFSQNPLPRQTLVAPSEGALSTEGVDHVHLALEVTP